MLYIRKMEKKQKKKYIIDRKRKEGNKKDNIV